MSFDSRFDSLVSRASQLFAEQCADAGTLVASYPMAVKRRFDVEREDWDAHVKVDYDEKRIPIQRVRRLVDFLRTRRLAVTKIKVLQTRKGYHLRLWLDRPIGPYTALGAQSLLGDDPVRQAFNARRVRRRRAGWNVLWNEKWRGETCVMREVFDKEKTTLVEGILLGSGKKGAGS